MPRVMDSCPTAFIAGLSLPHSSPYQSVFRRDDDFVGGKPAPREPKR
ncbi:hypothetical protein AZ78_2632 [Lysobacter capsici AZ78]|uniref:Uncharacterized protein n=1 Tax=Lysobacter capsici AZ78 TaxID=1444315 RepID=A0A108U9N7_9GAMM|nr:hypothetical protein AZ78_2632 [Lysobacter capsici AZ78]